VIHSGAPRSPEHYQQESGRAGRDGLPAECVLLYATTDFVRWHQLLEANADLTESSRVLLRNMEKYASGTRCRHRTLVEYFGESYSRGSCGACDWCLKELEPVPDATTVARKVLSCVARVRQSWGVGHVADVLVGRASERIRAAGHHELTTYGLLKEEGGAVVRGYIEQLVEQSLLAREGDPYPVLRLTAAGTAVLKGEDECQLFREVQPPTGTRRRGRGPVGLSTDSPLFEALRDVRRQLARERGVPPYVIFHDTTLRDMAERRPMSTDALYGIYGVGTKKALDFGEAFLAVIRAHAGQP